jgi:hypothetical protein
MPGEDDQEAEAKDQAEPTSQPRNASSEIQPLPVPPRPDLDGNSRPAWAVALEEAKDRRVLQCLHTEVDLQQAYANWCEQQNLPDVRVTGPYRNREEPDRLLFLVSLDLSGTNYRLNQEGLDAATKPVRTVRCWPASQLPADIPDPYVRRIATAGYLTHDPAVKLAEMWLEIALDPEYSDAWEL